MPDTAGDVGIVVVLALVVLALAVLALAGIQWGQFVLWYLFRLMFPNNHSTLMHKRFQLQFSFC